MFLEMCPGAVFKRWKVSLTSFRCPSMAPLESGTRVYAADTISNIGSSPREVSRTEFLLEVGHVLTVGDVEVVVWILCLEHLVWRVGSAYGHDSCWSISSLCLSDLIQGLGQCTHHHSNDNTNWVWLEFYVMVLVYYANFILESRLKMSDLYKQTERL